MSGVLPNVPVHPVDFWVSVVCTKHLSLTRLSTDFTFLTNDLPLLNGCVRPAVAPRCGKAFGDLHAPLFHNSGGLKPTESNATIPCEGEIVLLD